MDETTVTVRAKKFQETSSIMSCGDEEPDVNSVEDKSVLIENLKRFQSDFVVRKKAKRFATPN